jgi:DNA-binding LacI/PurR family transcriptional regulator
LRINFIFSFLGIDKFDELLYNKNDKTFYQTFNQERESMVTLKNIAENTGVSIGTVSAVLNKKRGGIRVGEATRLRVMEVARKLNYKPNTIARGLRTGRSYLIGVLISSQINTSFVPELIQGIEEVLFEQHLGMLLLTYKDLASMQQMVDFMEM